jgi:hypothetical protein
MPTCSGRHTMALTRRQRELFKEAEAIAALTKLDYHKIEEADPEARIPLLRIAINNMVIAQMVTCYTLPQAAPQWRVNCVLEHAQHRVRVGAISRGTLG